MLDHTVTVMTDLAANSNFIARKYMALTGSDCFTVPGVARPRSKGIFIIPELYGIHSPVSGYVRSSLFAAKTRHLVDDGQQF